MKFLIHYSICLLSMLLMDALWLGSMMNILYKKNIGHLMSSSPSWPAAILFYLLYACGTTILVLMPAIQASKPNYTVFLSGALLGLVAYGTYDLTNQATLHNWPIIVTIVDMIWGACMTGTASLVTYYLTKSVR
jgi:uncharacterized membrane protein